MTERDTDPRIDLAIGDAALRRRLMQELERQDVVLESITGRPDLLRDLAARKTDVIVVSRKLLDARRELLSQADTDDPEAPSVIVISEPGDPADRASLLAAGAAGVVAADLPPAELAENVAELARIEAEGGLDGPDVGGHRPQPRLADFAASRSPRMREFVSIVERIADSQSSLLIVGETGVGKERLARAVHAESPRAAGPFVGVNCGALPENLLESELFGHVAGAFTGARTARKGRFELAQGGTVFLDEVGEMPAHLQVKLLTVLQRLEVRPVGAEKVVPIDVRVMAATNRDLHEEVDAGRFREDLFYRLNVVSLEVPPLRERREDLPDLVGGFVRHFRSALGRERIQGITPDALDALVAHDWPGNVRELINVIERAVLLAEGPLIGLGDLPASISGVRAREGLEEAEAAPALEESLLDLPLKEARARWVASFEERYLEGLLRRSGGKVGETAKLAGINPRSLYDKMKRYGLRKEDFQG